MRVGGRSHATSGSSSNIGTCRGYVTTLSEFSDRCLTGKDQEGIGRGQSWQIPEETDRNHKKTQCNRCYTRDLKNEPLELKPDTLPLRQLVTLLLLVLLLLLLVVVVVGHHRHSH
jgi:hypothetical protein